MYCMKRLLIALVVCAVFLAFSAGCVGTPAATGGADVPSCLSIGAVPYSSEDDTTMYKNPDDFYYAED